MVSSLLLSLPDDLVVDQVRVLYDCVTICVRSTTPSAVCPLYSQPATRIHSRYRRTVADLPSERRQLVLSLIVRKFFCQSRECPRRIFAERFPDLVRPWARMTLRFCTELEAIGFATSGESGARLATLLGLPSSPATILRRLKAVSEAVSKNVTKVGIDDWAFRRGLKYGTILVDLETHRVIDLLLDRTVATATAWFKAHPEIQVISRDRGADDATAAIQGAPQAIQVADRWHIVHNLSEALSLTFEHSRAQIRSASHVLAPAPMAESETQSQQKDVPETSLSPLPIASGQPYRAPFIQHVQRARRESRLQRYQELVALQRQGMTTAQIAQQVGLSPRSIRRWLAQEHIPEGRQRRRRPSLLDPYEPYVLTNDVRTPMRIALLSDIHGNLVALERVLQERAQEPIDQVVCLGDVAARGPQPHEVIGRLRQLDCPVILGNTDAWL